MKFKGKLCVYLLSAFVFSSCALSLPEPEQTIDVTTKGTIKKIEFTSPKTEETHPAATTAENIPEEEEEDSFSDSESFIAYMRECMKKRMTEIQVRFTDGFLPSLKETVVYVNFPYLNAELRTYKDEGYTEGIYTTELYPGTKIADAYSSGDLSQLNSDELKVYKIAVEIVEKAKALGSPLQAERFIHDAICDAADYSDITEKVQLSKYCTAVGVFINGQANCQGYADAFYMLATMYGFETDKISGVAAQNEHVWNIIKLGDEWYSVDVCWDDNVFETTERQYIQYYYFNAPTEIMRGDHIWNDNATPYLLKKNADENYFYCADETGFGKNTDSVDKAVAICADGLISGEKESYVYAPYDESCDTADEFLQLLNSYITEKAVPQHISYNAYVKNIGYYTFFYTELT